MNANEETTKLTNVVEVVSIAKPENEPALPLPAPGPSSFPEALTIALEQITTGLRESGAAALKNMLAANDSYAKAIGVLEKLCKCALEWEEFRQKEAKQQKAGGGAGVSEETERQFTTKLEGPDTAA
jgi:hypothetical protein